MASQTIEKMRERAEVYKGDHALCKSKSVELLGLSNGLFPLEDIQEFGYNRPDGVHLADLEEELPHLQADQEMGILCSGGDGMKKATGVKTKELMLWLSVVKMYIDDPSSDKVTFKIGTGLSDSFPVPAFQL